MDASLARGSPSRDLSPLAPQCFLPATPWPHQGLSASACLPALAAWYVLRREEVVPMRPTSQGGKRPAHRTPRGNQCTAFARSARLLSRVKTSDDILASKALRLLLGSWLWERKGREPLIAWPFHISQKGSSTEFHASFSGSLGMERRKCDHCLKFTSPTLLWDTAM